MASSLSRLHSSEALASSSPLPAITCRWGVSNGPWPPLYSTSPLSFSHNKPPALSCRSSDKIIPSVIPPSAPSHTSLRCSGMTPWRQEMGICDGHFSPLALPLRSAPSSAHTWNGSQITSSTVSVLRQLLSLLVTSITPCLRSLVDFEWAFLYYPHSSAQWESSLC